MKIGAFRQLESCSKVKRIIKIPIKIFFIERTAAAVPRVMVGRAVFQKGLLNKYKV